MFSKFVRLGRDPELRYLTDGTAVMNLACVYNYGKKVEGKKLSQWIEISVWGKQAEGLHPHLHMGNLISISADDIHIEEFESKGEKRSKLVGRLAGFDFVAGQAKAEAPAPKPEPKPEPKPAVVPGGGFSDDDFDNVPF